MRKKVPKSASEGAEREFRAKADSTQYVDWSRAKRRAFSDLAPSSKTISLRLPELLLEELKLLAKKRDVPYRSLAKIFLAERVQQELRASRPKRAHL